MNLSALRTSVSLHSAVRILVRLLLNTTFIQICMDVIGYCHCSQLIVCHNDLFGLCFFTSYAA